MTTMAKPDPVLRRLFRLLDSAHRPKSTELAALMSRWSELVGHRIAPRTVDAEAVMTSPLENVAFIFIPADVAGGAKLRAGGHALDPLLGHCLPDTPLGDVPNLRGAVRLRRLFAFVAQTCEPQLAEFTTTDATGEQLDLEILITPLSDDGHAVTGYLGGVSSRSVPRRAT